MFSVGRQPHVCISIRNRQYYYHVPVGPGIPLLAWSLDVRKYLKLTGTTDMTYHPRSEQHRNHNHRDSIWVGGPQVTFTTNKGSLIRQYF